MTGTRKLFALLIAVLMVLAMMPAAAIAEEVSANAAEASKLALLDNAWESIEEVEAEAKAVKADPVEITKAAYTAALNNPLVDEGSLVWESPIQFAFTVDGMHCLYYYTARAAQKDGVEGECSVVSFAPKTCGYAQSQNVLLVGPYYGQDSSFTDQYKEESDSIAEATGGTCTKLTSTAATGPAIAQNYTDKGVVIYDSHGTQSGTSSYLCLTTNTGITSTDYNNGWAVSSGSAAFIDGRYIQNHASGTLSNCVVWMAICEGMKKEGQGTTGTALLAKGAAAVYGYSQSVSFAGDYEYEETFWTEMKNGAAFCDAIAAMKSAHGNMDPYTSPNAYPVVMSELDAFPSNPDSVQTVYCDWTLFSQEPIALESIAIADSDGNSITSGSLPMGRKMTLKLAATPSNANNYTAVWSVGNSAIASIAPAANGKSAVVTALAEGSTTVTVTVTTESKAVLTKTVDLTVTEAPKWNPTTTIVPGEEYLIGFESDGTVYLAVNYNVSASNHYYLSLNSNYYGYTAPATMQGESVIGVSGSADDLSYCTWTFESDQTGYIYSAYEEGVYLQAYSGSSYADLHPGTNSNFTWTYDAEGTLYTYTTENRYAQYVSSSGNDLMGVTGSVPTNSTVKLYSLNAEEPDPGAVYYTVTFVDWDGTVLKTQRVKEGNDAVAPANPYRPHYTFIGWDVDFTNVQSDLTVTAMYEEYVAPQGYATVTLTAGDVWGDGSGYQMLLDADATAYGTTIPTSGALTTSGDATTATYAEFEYKIPENADGSCSTSNIVMNSSVTISVPAGIYDWVITNPTPGDRIWIASNDGECPGRYDDFEFLPNHVYEFTVAMVGEHDGVTMTDIDPEATYYTVTFVDWDGTVLKTQLVKEGTAATAPADPTRPGYNFTGWSADFSNITSDLTVTATYVEKTNLWEPTDTIEAGREYLIGFVVDGATYLAVNYSTDTSNHYYNSINSSYFGYTALAAFNGSNVVDVSGNATDLSYCTWIFSEETGGTIQSGYESGKYLGTWSSTSWEDLYPGSSNYTGWVYDNHTLYRVVSSTNRYAEYYTNGSVDMMHVTSTVPTDCYVQLFVESTVTPPEPVTHTVTFADGLTDEIIAEVEVEDGAAATAPAVPEHTGYTFVGWDEDFSNVVEDMLVIALYEPNSYTLTINYVDEEGNPVADPFTTEVLFGDPYAIPSPEVEGYTTETTMVEGFMDEEGKTITVVYVADEVPPIPGTLLGDANCDGQVTMADVTALIAKVMNAGDLTEEGMLNADANQDGEVNILDAAAIYAIAFNN